MMEDSMDSQIGRYLSGEANEAEKAAFEDRLKSDSMLREQFMIFRQIWQHASPPPQGTWDTEKAWSKFAKSNQNVPLRQTKTIRSLSWAVAAAVVLALGAAVLFWNQTKATHYAFQDYQGRPVELPDGSKIYLNQDASVEVFPFDRHTRRVKLTGEAFFEVEEDKQRPFEVYTGGTITEVVGTSFNVQQSGKNTLIFVTQGKVIFSNEKDQSLAIALTSGEAAIFNGEEIQRIPNPSPNINAWHSRQLSFGKEMLISDIVTDLASYFKQDILIESEQIKKCRVTIPLSFKQPEMRQVLDAVTGTINASYAIEGEKCIIKGGYCP